MSRTLVGVALFVCAVVSISAQDRPSILNVTMSDAGDQLTISGEGFGSAPLVTIDGQPALVLPGATDRQVSVVTPAVLLTTSGTYRLTVLDSVRQVGEAFVVASRSDRVPSVNLTPSPSAGTTSGGIITPRAGDTPQSVLMPTTGGVVGISATENFNPSYTTALGYQALFQNTTGVRNVGIGLDALASNKTASNNTAVGTETLEFNTTGNENVALGESALFLNGTGSFNTAGGGHASYSNTTGIDNASFGYKALYTNNTGSYNTATGYKALYTNTIGHSNVASGLQALFSNTTGSTNTADGAQALYLNTTGSSNTATGIDALYSNTTGVFNTAIGTEAGFYPNTGSYNLFLGAGVFGTGSDTNVIRIGIPYDGTTAPPSGQNQTFIAGIRDTAVSGGLPVVIDATGRIGTAGGSTALSVLDGTNTQPYQLRLGYATGGADYGIGRNPSDGVLDFTATQSTYSGFRFNTPNAGTALAIANNGVVSILDRTNTQPYQLRLGYINGVNDYGIGRNPNDGYLNFAASQGTYSGYRFNTPNAGAVLTIGNNGNIGIGVTAPSQPLQLASGAYVSAGGVWTNASSRTLKEQIAPLSTAEAIRTVTDLSPVTFFYKAAPTEAHVGFIAEDVPDLVATRDRRSLATMDLVAVVTKVVQDQQRQLGVQDQQLHDQEQRLQTQNATVAELRERLARLEALLTRER